MARTSPTRSRTATSTPATALTFAEWDARVEPPRARTRRPRRRRRRPRLDLPPRRRGAALDRRRTPRCTRRAPSSCRRTPGSTVPELVTILGHAEVAAHAHVRRAAPDRARGAGTGRRRCDDRWSRRRATGRTASSPGTTCSIADDSEFQVPVELDDLADVMYTSGTTGLAQGHRGAPPQRRDDPEPRTRRGRARGWLHGAPMFTFAGIAFIYNPMKMGLRRLLPAEVRCRRVARLRRDASARRYCMLVPAFAELIVAHPDFPTADLSACVQVSIGSAPLAPKTHRSRSSIACPTRRSATPTG